MGTMTVPDLFVLFGDSITQDANDQSRGFALASALQARYVRRWDVVNRGFSAYNTDHALQVLPKALPTSQQGNIKLLTIFFGANDANTFLEAGQHVPLERYKSNLVSIINHTAVQVHSPKIILFTPPPVDEITLLNRMKEIGVDQEPRRQTVTATYADAVREVGRETGNVVLDVWKLFMTKAGWRVGDYIFPGSEKAEKNEVLAELLYDGLHLSPAGYEVVYEGLIKTLDENWPDMVPEKLPYTVSVAWEKELFLKNGRYGF
ncbi:GDSL-like Lipase/Acylhydrolase [Phlyctema vagabunda]|uniref:GDSL-like Lipase/Acylhydrolase n=1 Tax=Phlyctema vagabunda TaxID=108571 RepID=A0ABR4PX56_9HELO